MARRKKTEEGNMTLIMEDPNLPEIEDVTQEESPTQPTTLAEQQALALNLPDEKQAPLDDEPAPQPLTKLDTREAVHYLESHRLTPVYGGNNSMATCLLQTIDGKVAMPISVLTKKPQIAFGHDQDRALINAVSMHKTMTQQPTTEDIFPPMLVPDVKMPLLKFSPGSFNTPDGKPPKRSQESIDADKEEMLVADLIQALCKLVDSRIANADTGLRKKLKKLLEE